NSETTFATSTSTLSPTESRAGHYLFGDDYHARKRNCGTCLAEYSSGNWYRDKLRPGQYMCKSCYVCRNRKLKKTAPDAVILDAEVARRKKVPGGLKKDIPSRICSTCAATHSSGDWYRNPDQPFGFNCQKCYQRRQRASRGY
ncbi:hypothetical protein HDU91_000500, partial [Kappamyces sp. JEL0680]